MRGKKPWDGCKPSRQEKNGAGDIPHDWQAESTTASGLVGRSTRTGMGNTGSLGAC
jgi:hypothetical protein